MTYMYPDRYSSGVHIKWEIVPIIHTLKPSAHRIEQFHSLTAVREAENRWLPAPFLLSVTTFVWELRHRHSRALL